MSSTTRYVAVLLAAAAVVAAVGLALATGQLGRAVSPRAAASPSIVAPESGTPPGTSPEVTPVPRTGAAAYDHLTYPLDCGTRGVVTQFASDLDDVTGDGRPDAVRVVRCDAGAGSPPSAVYVYEQGPGGQVRLVQTLVPASAGLLVRRLSTRPDDEAAVSVTADSYSGPTVPRCCPDVARMIVWERRDGRLVERDLTPSR